MLMFPKSPGQVRTNPAIPALLSLDLSKLHPLWRLSVPSISACARFLSLTVGGAATGAGVALMRVVTTFAHTALLVSWVPAKAKGVTKAFAADVNMARNAKAEKRAMIRVGL